MLLSTEFYEQIFYCAEYLLHRVMPHFVESHFAESYSPKTRIFDPKPKFGELGFGEMGKHRYIDVSLCSLLEYVISHLRNGLVGR